MAESLRDEQWNHTAAVLAMVHNVNCIRSRDLRSADDFHPYKRPVEWGGGNVITPDNLKYLFA